MDRQFYVYMLASKRFGTLYVGVTNDLARRVWEHKEKLEGFTAEHNVDQLVWFEVHAIAETAITREKQIKRWKRSWKIDLIEDRNPDWRDLYQDLNK